MIGFRKLFFILFVVVCIFYGRAIVVTGMLSTNSYGLIMLASRPVSGPTLNPFPSETVLISPGTAEWILTSFNWPYRKFLQSETGDTEPQPDIHAAITFKGVYSNGAEVNQRMLRLIQHFIERGASIDERYMGYTPLHEAIISGDVEVAEFLIERGADLSATVHRPGRKHDGMNSLEFAQLLYEKDPKFFKETLAVINNTSD